LVVLVFIIIASENLDWINFLLWKNISFFIFCWKSSFLSNVNADLLLGKKWWFRLGCLFDRSNLHWVCVCVCVCVCLSCTCGDNFFDTLIFNWLSRQVQFLSWNLNIDQDKGSQTQTELGAASLQIKSWRARKEHQTKPNIISSLWKVGRLKTYSTRE